MESKLISAAKSNNVKELRRLIEGNHVNVNALDDNQYTPLHWAAQEGHLEAAKYLLEAKADHSFRGKWGSSVLYRAAYKGHVDLINLFWNPPYSMSLDDKTNNGNTAIHAATAGDHVGNDHLTSPNIIK